MKLLLTTNIIGGVSGVLNQLLWFNIPIPPVLNILIAPSVGAVTWIIMESDLVDLKQALKKLSLVFLIYAFLIGILLPCLIPAVNLLLKDPNSNPLIVTLFSSLFIGSFFSLGPVIYARFIKNSYWFKNQNSTGLTHELKSPLSNIQASTELALDQLKTIHQGNQNLEDYINIIKNNSVRLEGVVQNLLNLAKIQNQEFSLEKDEADLNSIVESEVNHYQPTAKQKGLCIKTSGLIKEKITCDAEKIRQVVSNLLSNAIKFSKEGQILANLQSGRGQVIFSVHDQGPGIAKENLKKVFERFFQGQKSAKGTGIGLTIAKGWVEAHGGKIWVESEGIGRGAKVIFSLPQAL